DNKHREWTCERWRAEGPRESPAAVEPRRGRPKHRGARGGEGGRAEARGDAADEPRADVWAPPPPPPVPLRPPRRPRQRWRGSSSAARDRRRRAEGAVRAALDTSQWPKRGGEQPRRARRGGGRRG
ncbi:unnamed protein product, partial [Prorocentrum cordatum]